MYKNINKKQLKEMMKNEKDVLLLDVRTKDEFKEYKIEIAEVVIEVLLHVIC